MECITNKQIILIRLMSIMMTSCVRLEFAKTINDDSDLMDKKPQTEKK